MDPDPARAVSSVRAQDYLGRLKELGWTTLVERRQQADMALMNGVMLQRMDIESINWFTHASNGEISTRQNTGRLNVRQSFGRLETRNNFYTVRMTFKLGPTTVPHPILTSDSEHCPFNLLRSFQDGVHRSKRDFIVV